jgi:hypothetical protein
MQLLPLRKNSATWDSIGYHVSDDARRLLLHGSLHSLAHGAEVAAVFAAANLVHHCSVWSYVWPHDMCAKQPQTYIQPADSAYLLDCLDTS